MSDQSTIEAEKLKLEVMEKAKQRYAEVIAQREEIMEAFLAKYQCQPDEMVQVQWRKSASEMLWFLVRKEDCLYCRKCNDKISDGNPVETKE